MRVKPLISTNLLVVSRSWIFKIHKKIVSLTELMAGVKAPSKTCQLFQLMCWPQGYKVPTSTNALVELMNMVERWRQRTDYGPVVVVRPGRAAPLGSTLHHRQHPLHHEQTKMRLVCQSQCP